MGRQLAESVERTERGRADLWIGVADGFADRIDVTGVTGDGNGTPIDATHVQLTSSAGR